MTALELLEGIIGFASERVNPTVDTVKAGDKNRAVKKAAVCFIATPEVIKASHKWGADVLITHEPTYHDHFDNFDNSEIETEKRALIDSTGMTVIRYHDHAHKIEPEIIHEGFLSALGPKYNYTQHRFYTLEKPMTPAELAELIESKTGTKHVKIVGKSDFPAARLSLFLGACGDGCHLPLKKGKADISICGEVCEWKSCEFVRDASQLGHNMAMLVLGHVGSEREGMKLVAEKIRNELGIEAKYFDCGEVYTYAD